MVTIILIIMMAIGYKIMETASLAVFGIVGLYLALLPQFLTYIVIFTVVIVDARIINKAVRGT
ncbi:hypothetical protein GFS03_09035 [Sulfolobus sp. E5-1-F]|uniref:hypothetical protein n=1 Tax=Saccharolobus sp. E5-1-F TaxID=2663019 RepID=UPI001296C23E|nr:hypothetical protein [Sulfolobus sp. E5-1-F]QGA54704.1 hypothetical protein GFS03_09035 [Sulfolobus sp. E5-1-F]